MKHLVVFGMLVCPFFSCAMQQPKDLKRKAESYLNVPKQAKFEHKGTDILHMNMQDINALYKQHELEQDHMELCNDFSKKITLKHHEELEKEIAPKNHVLLRLYHKKSLERDVNSL